MDLIPVKWKADFLQDSWWRIGLWVHVDLRAPLISLRFLWWTIGFGRMADIGNTQAWTTSSHKMPLVPSEPRVDYALDLINRAQDAVLEAAGELSGVHGFADQWKLVCDLHDQIKADWHRVEQARKLLTDTNSTKEEK